MINKSVVLVSQPQDLGTRLIIKKSLVYQRALKLGLQQDNDQNTSEQQSLGLPSRQDPYPQNPHKCCCETLRELCKDKYLKTPPLLLNSVND